MNQEELDILAQSIVASDINIVDDDVEKIEDEDDDIIIHDMPKFGRNDKVVNQLDDVTRESEEKATQIFDMLEDICDSMDLVGKRMDYMSSLADSNVVLFDKLKSNFPDIASFRFAYSENLDGKKIVSEINTHMQKVNDKVSDIMETMQYQDIHRQKIERVISVMRSLSVYMSNLFDSDIDDSKRTSSAKYIKGDANETALDNSDIDSLIDSFVSGGKK